MSDFTAQPGTEADLTALLTDAPDPTDHKQVREYLHRLAEAGLSVLLISPKAKLPFDGRTARKRTADDKAAQNAERESGRRNWIKAKSPAGVCLASADAAVLDGYLDEYIRLFGDAVNLAVCVGGSRVVVVDCDTPEQTAAFLADAKAPEGTAPTVTSPGMRGPDGTTMVHHGGGHFWFVVPDDVELPDKPESMVIGSDGAAYSVLWGLNKYVLIPPSVRAEGSYKVTGEVQPLPGWLCDRITEHAAARHHKRAERSQQAAGGGSADRITAWGAVIRWDVILAGTGWIAAGKADSCGCEIWTAPGDHADPDVHRPMESRRPQRWSVGRRHLHLNHRIRRAHHFLRRPG